MRCSFPESIRAGISLGLSVVVVVLAGCGNSGIGEVSGTVTLDGAPLSEGIVTFEDPSRGIGQSTPVKAGSYQMAGALKVGEYKVAVQPPSAPSPMASRSTAAAAAVPSRYSQPVTSGLTATVKAGTNKADFKLTK
ncbi:MAG: carboxypeptidase regulatory-like protein [Planctomycetaceae bacterium]|nr:carboxypeptidase regulatory-like protein [Planctomycetaceae bacterium]